MIDPTFPASYRSPYFWCAAGCAICFGVVLCKDTFVDAYSQFFQLFCTFLLLFWMQRNARNDVLSRLLFVFSQLVLIPPEMTPESMFGAHWLAKAHIVFSYAATSCAWACVCVDPNAGKHRDLLHTAILFQAATLITGMIWAADAPVWGALWQWDVIETTALCLFAALYAANRTHHGCYLLVCLWVLLFQIWSIYIVPSAQTRHSYGAFDANPLWYGISLCFAIVIILRLRRSIQHHPVHLCVGLVMSAIPVLVSLNIIDTRLLYPFFAVIWCIIAFDRKSRRCWVLSILGAATMILPAILGGRESFAHISLDKSTDGIQLLGIRVSQSGSCVQYLPEIRTESGDTATLSMQSCAQQTVPDGYRDILKSDGLWRIWALDYDSRSGVSVLLRNITGIRLYELWLVLLWLYGCGSLIRLRFPKERTNRILYKPEHDECH